jgi:hypothetical protein
MVSAKLPGGHTLLAWIAGSFAPQDSPPPETIMLATGTPSRVPGPARVLYTLPSGHMASQLALATGPNASLAWIEDYTDASGTYQSQVSLSGVDPQAAPVSFQSPGMVQSELSAAGDPAGDQLLAWSSCDAEADCEVMALTRSPSGSFAAPVALGAIDAGAEPVAAVGSGGSEALGWVFGGHVTLAYSQSPGGAFSYRALPGPGYAEDLTLAAGPGGRLLAAWTDGSPRQSLMTSLYSAR